MTISSEEDVKELILVPLVSYIPFDDRLGENSSRQQQQQHGSTLKSPAIAVNLDDDNRHWDRNRDMDRNVDGNVDGDNWDRDVNENMIVFVFALDRVYFYAHNL
ncbi:hypothetical protein EON65_52785 [archaeon]|nr:MAG: hypothetical protein EON65_52785 [archaeon]